MEMWSWQILLNLGGQRAQCTLHEDGRGLGCNQAPFVEFLRRLNSLATQDLCVVFLVVNKVDVCFPVGLRAHLS